MEAQNQPWVELITHDNYNYSELVPKIRHLFETQKIDVQEKSVLLKVSFVFPVKIPERTKMTNTNPHLISAVAQVLCERGASKIFIADAESAGTARYGFAMAEIKTATKQIDKKYQKRLVMTYLDEAHKVWETPENPVIPGIKLDFPSLVHDVDVFISMPKLKVNVFAGITLSVKNGMGFIKTATRWKYHNDKLHGMIADIYQLHPPDYVLTDAIFAGEGQGPMEATAYPMNLLIFGNNGLAVDTVCCNLMGYDPKEIPHLVFLHERNYGPLNLDSIRVNRPMITYHQHKFQRPQRLHHVDNPKFHYIEGEVCESGCPAFLRAMLDSYIMNKGPDSLGEMFVITGKNPQVDIQELKRVGKKRVIVYGNCAKAYAKYGRFYDGCPPNYMMAMATYSLKVPHLGLIPWAKYVNPVTLVSTWLAHWVAWFGGKKWKNIKKRAKPTGNG
jgi:uncharacterized protein (DUF362 family)